MTELGITEGTVSGDQIGRVDTDRRSPLRGLSATLVFAVILHPSPPGPLSHKGRGGAIHGGFRRILLTFAKMAPFFVLFWYCSSYFCVRVAVADKPYRACPVQVDMLPSSVYPPQSPHSNGGKLVSTLHQREYSDVASVDSCRFQASSRYVSSPSLMPRGRGRGMG